MGGDVIDSLSIELKSNSTNANAAVDKLIRKLDALQTSLAGVNGNGNHLVGLGKGIQSLGSGMQSLQGIGENKFERLANGINKLTNVNTSGLNKSASALRQISNAFSGIGKVSENLTSISTLTKSLSSLGNKSVSNAITNIPRLATAMKGLLTTLSSAPKVSSNVISMTNALANLSSQGQKVSSATKGIANAFKTYNYSATRSAGITSQFASFIGRLYQKYFYLKRILSGLGKAIKSSMAYVETLNYFEKSFGQVAQNGVKGWKKAGYDSAEEYYKSFSKRAKEVTKQMTGWEVSKNGTLDYSGTANLGIDPNKLMNYQAMFAQMSNSMGTSSENALKLSETLTKLGADLASVKNMDFDAVWKNMSSGIVGMSRAVDKFGINIRNVNLQQQLTDLGISAKIQNLNQQEKALLRGIIILKSTKYAWGDLADTIDRPANQLRLLRANFQNLTRTIGNIFLPIVAKVLPYINGLAIALQRLFTWIGKSLGIDVSKLTSSIGDSDIDISELLDDTDDLSDSIDDANDKAKKLKKTTSTIGIDKLNIISKDKDNTGKDKSSKAKGLSAGDLKKLSDAFDEWYKKYMKKWNDAFKDVQNNAQKIADKIVDVFKNKKFYEAGKYIGDKITKGLNSIPWDTIYDGSRDFGIGFAEFLNGLISPELFSAVGQTIAGALNTAIQNQLGFTGEFDFANLGDSIGAGITKFFKTFDFKGLATVLNNWANGILTAVIHAIGNINWLSVFKGAFDFFSTLEPTTVVILLLVKRFNALRKSMGLLKATGTVFKGTLQGLAKGIANLASSFKANGVSGTFKNFKTSLKQTGSQLTGMQKGVVGVVSVWAEWKTVYSTVKSLKKGTGDLVTGIVKIGAVSAVAATAMYTAFGPAGVAMVAITGLVAAIKAVADVSKEKQEAILNDYKAKTAETEKLTDEAKQNLKEYEDSVKSAQDQSVVQDKEVDKAKEYWKELQKIVDKNGKIKDGYKERANNLVTYINDTLGTEMTIVDGQITKYQELEGQIDEVIRKKRISNALDTYKAERDESEKNVKKYAGNLVVAEKDQKNAQNEYNKLMRVGRLIENLKTADTTTGEPTRIREKIATLMGRDWNLDSYEKTLKETKKRLKNANKDVAYNKKLLAENKQMVAEYDAMERAYLLGHNKAAAKHKEIIDKGILLAKYSTVNAVQQRTIELKKDWDDMQKLYENGEASIEDVNNAKKTYQKQLKQLLKFDINDVFDDSNGSDSWGARIKTMWNGLPEEIRKKFEEKYPQIKTVLNYATGKIINVDPGDAIKKDTLTDFEKKGMELINSFIAGLKSRNVPEELKGLFDLSGTLKLAFKSVGDTISGFFGKTLGFDFSSSITFNRTEAYKRRLKNTYATGGFPEDGLFFANHSELVGKFSNGKTAVANNRQITSGIEEAAYRGYMRALASQPSNYDSTPRRIEVPLYLNGRQIAKAVNDENARSGSTMLGNEAGY